MIDDLSWLLQRSSRRHRSSLTPAFVDSSVDGSRVPGVCDPLASINSVFCTQLCWRSCIECMWPLRICSCIRVPHTHRWFLCTGRTQSTCVRRIIVPGFGGYRASSVHDGSPKPLKLALEAYAGTVVVYWAYTPHQHLAITHAFTNNCVPSVHNPSAQAPLAVLYRVYKAHQRLLS
ncbi:hypothetical protein BOTBODRAFT_558306 [Botryobasidium botryosum FD-172 SS1]|uniref:Uncharacterized protein n=1 Tax=Botryobasidium botryosum (strain FD-172 SS1) TaxID=930990 RepID=A0A067M239_BOTB1|nr:hypothetical protein BOTBODRAFT_558306 [Botryobasidium botryosum FD-172 SS1]